MSDLFESAEKSEDSETSLSILKAVRELYDYFYAPGMNVIRFEAKFESLNQKVLKEIKQRERETGAKISA